MRFPWMWDRTQPQLIVTRDGDTVAKCVTEGTARMILHKCECYQPMLEALKGLYADATDRGETTDDDGNLHPDWQAASAAIAKAEAEK